MNLHKLILPVTAILLTIIIYACKGQITQPTPSPPVPLDSTSHEIIWEADTLGDWNSDLDAVWGSSPNDIWVAGWIVRGNWGTNFVHYDGEKWEDYDYFEAQLRGMFGLNENDIWAVGNNLVFPNKDALIAHYNGSVWRTVLVDVGTPLLTAVWASSANNVFAVGFEGTIMHYNGSNWAKMESGTGRNLFDVWGISSNDVYACGGLTGAAGDTSKPILLHYDGNKWSSLLDTVSNPNKEIRTVWGSSPDNIYFRGSYQQIGLYQGNITAGWNFISVPDDNTAIRKIRGSSSYNIFLVGAFGIIVHYNGHSWQRYEELLDKPAGPTFKDLIVIENTVYIVGKEFKSYKAIVYKGTMKN